MFLYENNNRRTLNRYKMNRCRCCKTGSSEVFYQSVNDDSYNSLTFKQMFEQSIGYPILAHEPQEFCNLCTETLVQWFEFKDLCKRTQETFVPMITIQTESGQEPVALTAEKEELDDLKPEMSIFVEPLSIMARNDSECLPNSSLKRESGDDSDKHVKPEPPNPIRNFEFRTRNRTKKVKITFETYIRYYRDEQGPEKRSIEQISVTTPLSTSMWVFQTQLWTKIKKYIIRQVLFTMEGMPIWTTTFRPMVKDLSHFVEFSYGTSSYALESITSDHLKLWNEKQVTLHIYPYSTSIQTKKQWIEVKNNLKNLKTVQETDKSDKGLRRNTEIAETTRKFSSKVSPSTSTNNIMHRQKIANIQKTVRNVIRSKVKKNRLEAGGKLEPKNNSEQPPSLESLPSVHQYAGTTFSWADVDDSGERPFKLPKLEPASTEDYESIIEIGEYDFSKVKSEDEVFEVE